VNLSVNFLFELSANHSVFAMDLDKFCQYYPALQTVALLVQLFTDVNNTPTDQQSMLISLTNKLSNVA